MPRLCVIYTCAAKPDGELTKPTILDPSMHRPLFRLPDIRTAIDTLAANDEFEMIGIRLADRMYTLVVITDAQTDLQTKAFELGD